MVIRTDKTDRTHGTDKSEGTDRTHRSEKTWLSRLLVQDSFRNSCDVFYIVSISFLLYCTDPGGTSARDGVSAPARLPGSIKKHILHFFPLSFLLPAR